MIVPSILLLITLRHGMLTYTPWLLISIALILVAAGDTLFSSMSMPADFDRGRIAFPLYNAGNLCFAGALVWYNMFGVYDRARALKSYQERNR